MYGNISRMIALPGYHRKIIIDSNKLMIGDHLNGFNSALYSLVLDEAIQHASRQNISTVVTAYCFDDAILTQYPDIEFYYDEKLIGGNGWTSLLTYNTHPQQKFKNFLCSFNGSKHVSRILLVSVLQRYGWFNPDTCSKNFQFSPDKIDGHISDYLCPEQHSLYRKFFITDGQTDFFNRVYSFGHNRFDHAANIHHLADKIAGCFMHVVSETLATSYYPFVTEKFLYSLINRGLFLAYAQPGWHDHLERYYGFQKYNKIFDYRFDSIQNPVERLVELMSMISKFAVLSPDDWRDLYEMEIDTIEYNYHHYFNGDYKKTLENRVGI